MTFVVEGVNIHRETINAQLASLKLYMQYWKTPRGVRESCSGIVLFALCIICCVLCNVVFSAGA